jgi:exodeoxyribonuclease VII large subunit
VRAVEGGQLVRSVSQIAPGQGLSLEFADGRADAIATGGDGAPPPGAASGASSPLRAKPARVASPKPLAPKTQGDLF